MKYNIDNVILKHCCDIADIVYVYVLIVQFPTQLSSSS